jgi:hypothetical protein
MVGAQGIEPWTSPVCQCLTHRDVGKHDDPAALGSRTVRLRQSASAASSARPGEGPRHIGLRGERGAVIQNDRHIEGPQSSRFAHANSSAPAFVNFT